MTLIDFCAEKIVSGYGIKCGVKYDLLGIKMLLACFPDRFLSYRNTVAIFLLLTDETFATLKRGELDLTDHKVILPLFKEDGGNVHIVGVVSDSVRDMVFLCRYIKRTSLSWYRPDMSKLVIYERS
jgi:hypothetical protein